MATVSNAIRTTTGWTDNQAAMEALYGVDGYYTLLSLWEDDIPADLVAAGDQWVAECYNDWPAGLSDSLAISNRTTDSDNNIEITSPEGERHNGTSKSGFFIASSARLTIEVECSNVYTYYIECENTSTSLTASSFHVTNGFNVWARSCIFSTVSGGSSSNCFTSNGPGDGVNGIDSCLLFDSLYGYREWYSYVTIKNCTIVNCGTGIQQTSSRNIQLTNNVVFNCTTSYIKSGTGSLLNSFNNAASDATTNTPPGTDPLLVDIVSSDFVDSANNNYLPSATSQLIMRGVNLYADFTTDITGTLQPVVGNWDIGAGYYRPPGTLDVKIALRDDAEWALMSQSEQDVYRSAHYDDIVNALGDLPIDFASRDEEYILECFNDWPSGYSHGSSSIFVSSSFVTSVSNRLIFSVPDSEKYQAINNGVFFINTATMNIFNVGPDNVVFEHLRCNISVNTGTFIYSTTADNVTIRYCNINTDGNATTIPIHANTGSGSWIVHNNLLTASVGGSFSCGIRTRTGTPQIYNNTVIGYHRNYRSIATSDANNNIAFDANDYDYDALITGDYNASEDNTASGANSITGISSTVFNDFAGGDYTLSSGSPLRDAGTNLTYLGLFTKDMLGNDYPSTGDWDLGIAQYDGPVGPESGKIYLGGTEITAMKLGSTDVTRAYLGPNQVFGP